MKALSGLDEMARKEVNWEQLEQLASEDKLILYGGAISFPSSQSQMTFFCASY